MLQTILNAKAEHAFSATIISEFLSMIEKSQEMLGYTFKTLSGQGKGKKATEKIYVKDQMINFSERSIRKRVLVHLALKSNANLPEYLGLISIAKDAERLGDYIKNVFELNQLVANSHGGSSEFTKFIETTGGDLLDLFDIVVKAFRGCDRDLALLAIKRGDEIARICEETIESTIKSGSNVPKAVVLVLGARYLKRIARHLVNIASSVVNPMPDLDFSITPDS